MKFVKWILIVLAGLLGLFFLIALFLPKKYHVERSVTIFAPAVLVYSQVVDLEAWQEWNPWKDLDPQMTIVYGDTRVGTGASYSWQSNVAGNGTMSIIDTRAPSEARYKLVFQGYEDRPSFASFILRAPDPLAPTEVTWTFDGDLGDGLASRWVGLLMDRLVGKNYEQGLQSLKDRCEGMSVPAPAAPQG